MAPGEMRVGDLGGRCFPAHAPGVSQAAGTAWALAVAWTGSAGREGELLFPERGGDPLVLGGPQGASLVRQRPGADEVVGPLAGDALLRVEAHGDALRVTALRGKIRGRDGAAASIAVTEETILSVEGELIVVATRRPRTLPAGRARHVPPPPAFGRPDAFGLVGESPGAWQLRDLVAVASRVPYHLLVEGPTGVGKGIVARALHGLSPRAARPIVVCSDGILPTPDEILARAEGGTFVIDPVEALGPDAQARLLHFARTQRVESLAAEGKAMQVRVVVLAREASGPFGDELRARFVPLRVPDLDARREDVPLVMRERALRLATANPALGERFVDAESRTVRFSFDLMNAVMRRPWSGGAFEMDRVLFAAMSTSHGDCIEPPTGLASSTTPARGGLMERLRLPVPQRWDEVRIRPVDGLTVLVTVRDRSARCSHVELDLASAKSRGPTRAWEMLIAACEERGTLRWRQFGDTRDTVRKQVERLNEALSAAFLLDELAFEAAGGSGWTARFLAVPER